MSIAADIGQIAWLGFEGTSVPAELADDIAGGRVGAVILFARNLVIEHRPSHDGRGQVTDIRALVELNRSLRASAPADGPPLWIAVDQEGGRVQRVRAPAPAWPAMLELARAGTVEQAAARCRTVGQAMGRELAALGFDVDFAPVLDVHTNPDNPIIGTRAFACEPERAAATALAFAAGLEEAGVLACGKHFPGHGDTDVDSHLALPRLSHDLSRLQEIELLPFRRAIAAGLPMIMTAHVVFAAIDARVPATLSEQVVTGLLREQLGYDGIVVSDDLDMRAIADRMPVGEAAVAAVRAGCDALLLCRDRDHQEQARSALLDAAQRDADIRANIARAAARIRLAKARHAARNLPVVADADVALGLFSEHRQRWADGFGG